MADQLAFLPERVFTAAAMPGAGYRVQFFQSGTTTPVAVFTSPALSTAHPSPLPCDATGVFPAVFSPGGAIKAVVTKPDGSTHYTLDPVFRVPTSSSGAAEITFSPTVALPFENVQAAIEGAAATAASGFTPFGLGVTGTNALVANIDATNIASGSYRFDNTTTGTFPSGVVASDTGTLQIDRENSGDAMMFLQSGASLRMFARRMASSAWGAWQEVIAVPAGAVQGDLIYRDASAWARLAKGSAAQFLTMNSGATAPEWTNGPIRARANFDGRQVAGTYSRTGTLVTVTQTGHGLSTGMSVTLDFTSGTATDGTYAITVVDANTYTVTDSASGTTSGNLNRNMAIRSSFNVSSIVRNATGQYTITFTTALADANYTVLATGRGFTNHPIGVVSIDEFTAPTTTTLVIGAGNSGGNGSTGQRVDQAHINIVVIA